MSAVLSRLIALPVSAYDRVQHVLLVVTSLGYLASIVAGLVRL